jgi:hypothetical protein
MVLASIFFVAGCSLPMAKMRKVDQPKEEELRANWKNYHTYCLGNYAVLFQVKGDTTIEKRSDWREVTSDEMAYRCAGFESRLPPVTELRGANDTIFGYVIYNYRDQLSALVIDSKTISLFYNVAPKGP